MLSRLSKLFLFLLVIFAVGGCDENSKTLKLDEQIYSQIENIVPNIDEDLKLCNELKKNNDPSDKKIQIATTTLFYAQRVYEESDMIALSQCLEDIVFVPAENINIRSDQLSIMGPLLISSGINYFQKTDKEIVEYLKSFEVDEDGFDWFGLNSNDMRFVVNWNVEIMLTRYYQNHKQFNDAEMHISKLKEKYSVLIKMKDGELLGPVLLYIVNSFEFQNAYGLNDLKTAKELSDQLYSNFYLLAEFIKANPGWSEYLNVVVRNLEYMVFVGNKEDIKKIINQCLQLIEKDIKNRNTKLTKLALLNLLNQVDPNANISQEEILSLEKSINQLNYETLFKSMDTLLVKRDFSNIDQHIQDAENLCKNQILLPRMVFASDCPMRDAISHLKEDMTEEILALEKDVSLKNYYQNDINRIRKDLNDLIAENNELLADKEFWDRCPSKPGNSEELCQQLLQNFTSGDQSNEAYLEKWNIQIREKLNDYKFNRFWAEYTKFLRQAHYQRHFQKDRYDLQQIGFEMLIDPYNKLPAFSGLNNKTSGSDSRNFVAEKLNNNDPDMIRIVDEIERETYIKDLSHLFMAAYFAKKYINLFQDIRVDLIQFSKEDELSFTEAYKNTLKKYVPLFYQVNDINAAMSTFNIIKENEYYEFIRRASVSKDFFSRIAFTDREQEFENNLKPYQDAVQKLNTEYNNLLQSDPTSEKIKIIQEQIIQKLDDIETIHYAYLNQDFLSEIDPTRGGAVALTNESRNIDDALNFDANSTRTKMYISVDQNQIQTYIVGKDFKERFSSQINKIDLIKLVNEIAIQVQQKKVIEPLTIKKISNLMVQEPFKFLKEKNINDLQIYLTDNFLIPIPFGLLEFNNQKVLDQFNIEYLNLKKNTKGNFAKNNHFDLFGATEGNEDFDDLPGVKDEINLLVKASANKTSSQDVFLGKDFNKRTLIQSFNDNTNYIHLASHLKITGNADDLIYLYLGDKSTINLRDLRENMPHFDNELVTLSACETANLFDIDHDQSFDGLAGIFQEKGAKNVLATLWKVSDEATSNFMYVFYTLLSHNNLDYAEALTLTQRLFFYNSLDKLPSNIKLAELNNKKFLNKIKKFNHPYFWSPFIIYSSN